MLMLSLHARSQAVIGSSNLTAYSYAALPYPANDRSGQSILVGCDERSGTKTEQGANRKSDGSARSKTLHSSGSPPR